MIASVDLKGDVVVEAGLFSKANGGYLILPANLILANPGYWPSIKSAIQGKPVKPLNVSPTRLPILTADEKNLTLRLLLLAIVINWPTLSMLTKIFNRPNDVYRS